MAISVNSAMRAGLVSGKAAGKWKKPAILSQTRSQKGQMVAFDGRMKDEAAKGNGGAVPSKREIENPAQQRDRVSSMPSKKTGGAGYAALTRGSKSPQGGAADTMGGSYTPGVRAVDQFPQKQASVFPKGGNITGSPDKSGRNATGNTRMKGKQPMKSGGPSGGNANSKSYYGGPKGRDGGS